jgi:hypothetical protein
VTSARIDVLQAAQFIADSWRRVSTKIIQKCIANCGFKHTDLTVTNNPDSENDGILEMHQIGNYELLFIDNSLQCYNGNGDCEESIVEQI